MGEYYITGKTFERIFIEISERTIGKRYENKIQEYTVKLL
jgi:hypothetical protein